MKMDTDRILNLLIGLQASGKSTFAKTHFANWTYISLDVLRTRRREWEHFSTAINHGETVVVDNTNPTVADRLRYIDFAKHAGYIVKGYFLQSRLQACIDRNDRRVGKARIPVVAISATSNKLEMPSYQEGYDELYFVSISDGDFRVDKWEENAL